MKKSQQPALFIWVLILLVWGLFSACSLQNNALPNLPPDNAQASSNPISEKDQFLACLPQIRALKGSNGGRIIMETDYHCNRPEEIESVQYYLSSLNGGINSIRSHILTAPYKVDLKWENGLFYFSETRLKSGAILRSKNNILNPYDISYNTFSPAFSTFNLQCLPKVFVKDENSDSFSLIFSTLCIQESEIDYLFYTIASVANTDKILNRDSKINENDPDLFTQFAYQKLDTPPFEKKFFKCSGYSGESWYISPQVRLKSGEYLTANTVKIDFPKSKDCPPPAVEQSEGPVQSPSQTLSGVKL